MHRHTFKCSYVKLQTVRRVKACTLVSKQMHTVRAQMLLNIQGYLLYQI